MYLCESKAMDRRPVEVAAVVRSRHITSLLRHKPLFPVLALYPGIPGPSAGATVARDVSFTDRTITSYGPCHLPTSHFLALDDLNRIENRTNKPVHAGATASGRWPKFCCAFQPVSKS